MRRRRLTLGRNRRWFGPMPSILKLAVPVSWEGYAVTVVFVLGFAPLKMVDDPIRRAIAMALWMTGYCAVVFLTWSNDPD